MHDESLEPRVYARLHADRYLWQEQQERAAVMRLEIKALADAYRACKPKPKPRPKPGK